MVFVNFPFVRRVRASPTPVPAVERAALSQQLSHWTEIEYAGGQELEHFQ